MAIKQSQTQLTGSIKRGNQPIALQEQRQGLKRLESSQGKLLSGDKEAIANAQQLIALRQREVEDAIKQRDKRITPNHPP